MGATNGEMIQSLVYLILLVGYIVLLAKWFLGKHDTSLDIIVRLQITNRVRNLGVVDTEYDKKIAEEYSKYDKIRDSFIEEIKSKKLLDKYVVHKENVITVANILNKYMDCE